MSQYHLVGCESLFFHPNVAIFCSTNSWRERFCSWGFSPMAGANNRIEANHVHNTGNNDLSDLGGIYMLGVQPNSTVRTIFFSHALFAIPVVFVDACLCFYLPRQVRGNVVHSSHPYFMVSVKQCHYFARSFFFMVHLVQQKNDEMIRVHACCDPIVWPRDL